MEVESPQHERGLWGARGLGTDSPTPASLKAKAWQARCSGRGRAIIITLSIPFFTLVKNCIMPEIFIKLSLAVLFGAIIGFEREYSSKAAGFRTITMITLGSCLFTMLSLKIG